MRSRAALLYHISDTQNHLTSSKETSYEGHELYKSRFEPSLEILLPEPELDIVTRFLLASFPDTPRRQIGSTEIDAHLCPP